MHIKSHYIIAIIALLLSSGSAVAKTDLPADGNGTGGVTNNTSVPPPPAPGSISPTPEEYGKNYDKQMRKWLNMPSEWLKCKTSDDCIIAHVPCNTGLAVSKQYKNEAQNLICHGECIDVCDKSEPDTSRAVCKNGQCATIIYPYNPW